MRISDYASVTSISNSDKLLGTQGQGTNNFPVTILSDYILSRITTTNKTALANSINVNQTSGTIDYSRVANVTLASTSASGIINSSLYSDIINFLNRPNKLVLISSATNSTNQDINDVKTLDAPFNFVTVYVEGPNTGDYQATIYFYTTNDDINLTLVASTTINKDKHKDYAQIITDNKKWCSSIVINNGTVPAPGITTKVLV